MNGDKKSHLKYRVKKAIELSFSFIVGLLLFSLIEGFDVVKHSYLTVLICMLILFLIGFLIPVKTKDI